MATASRTARTVADTNVTPPSPRLFHAPPSLPATCGIIIITTSLPHDYHIATTWLKHDYTTSLLHGYHMIGKYNITISTLYRKVSVREAGSLRNRSLDVFKRAMYCDLQVSRCTTRNAPAGVMWLVWRWLLKIYPCSYLFERSMLSRISLTVSTSVICSFSNCSPNPRHRNVSEFITWYRTSALVTSMWHVRWVSHVVTN